MLERTLIPLDGSPEAEAILPTVKGLLGRKKGRATVLQARVPSVTAYPGIDYAAVLREERARAEAYLEALASGYREESWTLRTRVVDGTPAEAILRASVDERVSMIAMTTHGRSGVLRWILGSVAEKVLRGSDVPVLLLRSPAGERAGGRREIRRILLPVEGSGLGAEAVQPVIELARQFKAEVLALHVKAPPDLPVGYLPVLPAPPPRSLHVLAPVVDLLEAAGVEVKVRTMKGDPADAVLNLSDAGGADLIAMTTHGRSGFSRWTYGSVTEKVLRASPVPLLVVRSKRAAASAA